MLQILSNLVENACKYGRDDGVESPSAPIVLRASVQGAAFSGIGYVSGETPGSSLKSVLVRDTATTLSAPRRFMRLRVTR